MSEKNKTLEQKMAELADLIAWFDGDDFAIDQAIEKFKAAEKLAGTIESDLSELKNEIVALKQKFDGEV